MAANPFWDLPAAPSVAAPFLYSPSRSFGRRAYFLILFETVSPPRRSRAPNRPICSRGPPPRRSRAPNRPICSRDPHPAPSRAPNRQICSRDPHPAPSRAPNRLICSRDPPSSIPEPVDESILSPDKFVIKPDVIRIAVLLTEVGEGIFTARSRVARFAVSLNE